MAKALSDPANGEVWLRLEFGKTYFIGDVTMYLAFYTDWLWPNSWFTKSITNYKNYVDINNNIDVSVYHGDVKRKLCGTVQRTYGLEQTDQIYTLICNAEGDSVKLSKSTGNIIVCEVVVLLGTPGPTILDVQGK